VSYAIINRGVLLFCFRNAGARTKGIGGINPVPRSPYGSV
jgi:hypothetical protein